MAKKILVIYSAKNSSPFYTHSAELYNRKWKDLSAISRGTAFEKQVLFSQMWFQFAAHLYCQPTSAYRSSRNNSFPSTNHRYVCDCWWGLSFAPPSFFFFFQFVIHFYRYKGICCLFRALPYSFFKLPWDEEACMLHDRAIRTLPDGCRWCFSSPVCIHLQVHQEVSLVTFVTQSRAWFCLDEAKHTCYEQLWSTWSGLTTLSQQLPVHNRSCMTFPSNPDSGSAQSEIMSYKDRKRG